MTDRKKPGVAFWGTVVVVVVLVVYPLSIGPVEWLRHEQLRRDGYMPRSIWDTSLSFYAPLTWIYTKVPRPVRGPMDWYADFWH